MKPSNNSNQAIQSYLEKRAKTDELFAKSYAKKNKSIDECFAYIMGEALKSSSTVIPGAKGCMIDDAEVFGLAVHYYDEDDIKIAKMPANVKASVSNTAATTKPVQKPEPANPSIAKKQKSAKREEDSRQMSLF